MLFNYRYGGNTTVTGNSHATSMSFAPDTLREPTFFVGKLHRKIAFREAISALHDVVVSDLRFRPKDKTEYKAWVARQEAVWLAEFMGSFNADAANLRIAGIREELRKANIHAMQVMTPYYKAQKRYFNHIYSVNRDAWFVLDPVITIHPDELFFECFSEDESSYGRLAANYNVFKELNEFKCGTTNIDYSAALYNEFQKIRSYKETDFRIDPGGFEIQTSQEELFKEIKIDLPESWVRGFLQVSSAMTLPAVSFDLHPLDMYNFCLQLRRFKETKGPRSIRYVLKPGQPVTAVFEPWNTEIICSRSVYTGNTAHEIRVWGRRRLLILERFIPVAKRFTVNLLGSGMPSFYVADLGDMNFTLGLSGWTANDWSRSGNFDLLAPRQEIDAVVKQTVFQTLKKHWFAGLSELVKETGYDAATVTGALTAYTQAGRVMYDINNKLYRVRELTKESLSPDQLRFASPQEEAAAKLLGEFSVDCKKEALEEGYKLRSTIKTKRRNFNAELIIDKDERIIGGNCDCSFYVENKLHKGPCEHMLAMRLVYNKTKEKLFA